MNFDYSCLAASKHAAKHNKFVGTRLNERGIFLPEPGNTIIRHVIPGRATEIALVKVRETLLALPWGKHFAFTDTSSFHMTVFDGLIETRREKNIWPPDLPFDMPISQTTEIMKQRLSDFQGPGSFDMKIHEVTPNGVTMIGATNKDETTVRNWREALTEPFGFRHPKHDAYVFHITLAYLVEWMPDNIVATYRSELGSLTEKITQDAPVADLEPPKFCEFPDMNSFRPVLTLKGFH